jgi:BRCT domain type II-containing protein
MHKTTQELQAEIEVLENGMAQKSATPDRIRIYQNTIAKIKGIIKQRQEDAQPTAASKPADMTTYRQAGPTNIKIDVSPGTKPGMTIDLHEQRVVDMPKVQFEVTANLAAQKPTVTITWSDATISTHTEGDARSKFTSLLRDLDNSTLAEQSRFDFMRTYRTYDRAKAYYKALAAFWGHNPTARELDLTPLSTRKATIFNMIVADCANPPDI